MLRYCVATGGDTLTDVDQSIGRRDGTFFDKSTGALSDYAKGPSDCDGCSADVNCCVYLPSWGVAVRTYEHFDKVSVIFQGWMTYFGHADQARQYFIDLLHIDRPLLISWSPVCCNSNALLQACVPDLSVILQ